MPIPTLSADGFLPAGIFDCALPELKARFGVFQGTDQRLRLFARLEALLLAMGSSRLFEMVLVDGSFVTAKPAPNDIDLIAVLHPGHDFERDLPMSEYALMSRTLLRRRFGFDVVIAEQGSSLYKTYVEFFGRVREAPEARKGLLRLRV
jgi:hypothetical protein